MIYSGKTTSVKEVIAKIYRDLSLTEETPQIDFIEWAAEALEKIGAFTQLETKTESVTINNYKGELPTDFVYPHIITYNGYPIVQTTSITQDPPRISRESYPPQYSPYIEKYQNATFVAHTGFEHPDEITNPLTSYMISNGCIKVGVQSGYLKIVYAALPLDCDGYPLVPDYVEFKEAIYWYINMKYSYAEWRRGSIRDGVYKDAERNWHWYCQQAANKAMIPDLAMMENIKRNYLQLKPDVYRFEKLFN